MGIEATADLLPAIKQVGLFFMAAFAVSVPSIFGQIEWIREQEPGWMCLFLGLICGLLGYVIFYFGFGELTKSSMLSGAVLMGLITAHVAVFRITNEFVGVMYYFLFIFVFYWDFAEANLKEDPSKKTEPMTMPLDDVGYDSDPNNWNDGAVYKGVPDSILYKLQQERYMKQKK
nr:hypothetical protein [Sicyoidochytrium minutum DNA virus]